MKKICYCCWTNNKRLVAPNMVKKLINYKWSNGLFIKVVGSVKGKEKKKKQRLMSSNYHTTGKSLKKEKISQWTLSLYFLFWLCMVGHSCILVFDIYIYIYFLFLVLIISFQGEWQIIDFYSITQWY